MIFRAEVEDILLRRAVAKASRLGGTLVLASARALSFTFTIFRYLFLSL